MNLKLKVAMLISMPMLLCQYSWAQQILTEPEAISEMSFLIGTWTGQGWMEFKGQRYPFKIVETVLPKLNGSVLQIDGLSDNHQASTTFWYDRKTGLFQWQSHTFTKAGTDSLNAVPTVKSKSLIWQTPRNENSGLVSRFTITLNENGQWFEIGEQTKDGITWIKFLEQTLSKSK